MSTTTKNVGRVSIVPKGDWNINNTYIRLDLVTYNGNSYIAKKDVPKNIQLSNNNYWMLMASKGGQGEQGEQGAPFAIMKSYASIAAMNADFSNTDVQNGQFVIIDTGNVQDPDNAKLYYKGNNSYVFVTDLSGAAGIQGPRGASAYEQAVAGGYTGTEAQFNEELASFKELSDETKEAAPFYAEYGVTTKAEIASAINGKRQIYAYRNSELLKPMLPYIGETRYGSTYPGDIGYVFALTVGSTQTIYSLTDQWMIQEINLNEPAQRAEAAADQALARMNSADASAQAAASSATAAGNAQTAAETAQSAAEDAQAAAEAVLASIPEDYTELSEDVDNLKSAVTLYTGNGEIVFTDGYYINTSGNTVDITAPTSSTTGYKYAIVSCSEGEKFTVTSSGGQTPRAYCFINDSESQTAATVVGRRAGSGEPVTDVVITAPANATKLVINAKSTEKSYYGVILKNRVDDLDDKLNDPVTGLATKINDSLTVDIEPVQEGEGNPSPENVRPITGWTGCKVFYPGLDITRDLHIVKNKYINASGVETKSITTDLSHTVYFPVTPGMALYFSSYWDELPGSAPSIAFYDASKTFKQRVYFYSANSYKGAIGYNFVTITVPNDCYYAILNFNYGVCDRIVLADDDPVITFPSPDPGTVYGGVLSCSNGKWTLSVDHYVFTVTGNNITSRTILGNNLRTNIMSVNSNALTTGRNALAIANWLPRVAANYDRDVMGFYFDNEARFYVKAPISAVGDTLESVKTYFDENPLVIVYPLATPIVYDLSDAPEITTLLDTNSIWANTGDVTVTYGTYLEMIKDHADQVGDNILNAIAPLETTYTASQNYTVGSYIFVGTKFYKVTADIAEGGTITPNVNVIQTTVGEQSISVLRDLPQNPYKHIAKNKIADNDYEWSSLVKDIKSTCHLHMYQGLYFTRARLAGYDHIAISNYHASKPTVPIADVIKTLNNYDASRDDVPDTWLENPNAEHAYFTDANSYVGSPAGTHLHLCSVGSYVTSGSDNTGAGAGGFEGTVLDFAKAFEEMRQYPNGGGITINHPVWSGIDKDGILNLLLKVPNIFGMEIYNASSEHSGTGYALDLWDEVLATGNQIFGTAVPDHEVENKWWNNHLPLGFVHLLCITKTDQEIMLAYRNGRFYTTVENDTLLLKFFGIDNNGLVTFKATDTGTIKFVTAKRSVSVENNNIATFQTNSDDVYVRAEIETETNRLFTNAIIL